MIRGFNRSVTMLETGRNVREDQRQRVAEDRSNPSFADSFQDALEPTNTCGARPEESANDADNEEESAAPAQAPAFETTPMYAAAPVAPQEASAVETAAAIAASTGFISAASSRPIKRLKKSRQRCRKCGNSKDTMEIFIEFHTGSRQSGRNVFLTNIPGQRYHNFCTTPTDQYQQGYPLAEGAAHPRRRRGNN